MELEALSMQQRDKFIAFRHLAAAETKYVNDVNELIAEELIYKFTTLKNREAYLLVDDGCVIGNLFLVHRPENKELYIDAVAVLQSYHGTAAATLLMNKAFEIAKENEYREITLVVRDDNVRAIRFYQKYRFQYRSRFDEQRQILFCPLKYTESLHVYRHW